MFNHELCLMGIKLKMDECKIEAISNGPFEKWDYYNHFHVLATINKAINKEIDYSLYIKWTKLLGNCITFYPSYFNEYKKKIYDKISNLLLEASSISTCNNECLSNLRNDLSIIYKKYELYEKYSLEYLDEHEKIYIA